MLQDIRDRVTGWIAWVIVGLLIIPFALWGVNEYLGGGSVANVAIVNDVPISKAAFLNQYEREVRARKTRPEGAEVFQLKQAVLDRIIGEELLTQLASENGYRISNAMLAAKIRATSYFQNNGQFDEELYRNLLQSNGMTPDRYQDSEGRSMVINQVISGVTETGFVTAAELSQFIRLKDRQLDLSYIVLPASRYQEEITVGDEKIAAYYEANKDSYMTVERVKVKHLQLDVRDIESTIDVTEAQIESAYEERKDSYRVAEQRQVSHILIELAEGAKEEDVTATLDKAKDIKKKLDAGADFTELAKKHSEDIGSAGMGGDIGVLEKGSMDPSFEAAAYQLKEGEISEPVRSTYGFHIIKLTSLKSESGKSFEEARAEVEAQYRQREAEGIFYDRADLLIDLTYENPESLDIAAKELGLEIKESEWFTRQGSSAGIAKYPNVVNAAFSEDALAGGEISKGNNSKSIELQGEDTSRLNPMLVLHVSNYKPIRQRTIQEVRSMIETSLQQEEVRLKAQEEAERLLANMRNGMGMEKLAKDNQLELTKAGYIKRTETGYDADIVRQAFSVGSKATGTVYDSVELATGGAAIISISGEKQGESLAVAEQEKKYLSQFIQKLVGSSELEAMVKMIREESEVVVFEDRLKDDET